MNPGKLDNFEIDCPTCRSTRRWEFVYHKPEQELLNLCKEGDIGGIKELYEEQEVRPDIKKGSFLSALIYQLKVRNKIEEKESEEMIEFLISEGAPLKYSLIYIADASQNPNYNLVRRFVKLGAETNYQCQFTEEDIFWRNRTLLEKAILKKDLKLIEILYLNTKTQIDISDEKQFDKKVLDYFVDLKHDPKKIEFTKEEKLKILTIIGPAISNKENLRYLMTEIFMQDIEQIAEEKTKDFRLADKLLELGANFKGKRLISYMYNKYNCLETVKYLILKDMDPVKNWGHILIYALGSNRSFIENHLKYKAFSEMFLSPELIGKFDLNIQE